MGLGRTGPAGLLGRNGLLGYWTGLLDCWTGLLGYWTTVLGCWTGLGRIGSDWTGPDRVGVDWAGSDWTGLGRTGGCWNLGCWGFNSKNATWESWTRDLSQTKPLVCLFEPVVLWFFLVDDGALQIEKGSVMHYWCPTCRHAWSVICWMGTWLRDLLDGCMAS